jgi:mono/diheme cytochrome c family protein
MRYRHAALAAATALIASILIYALQNSGTSSAPAPIDQLDASADAGRYLATIANCATCHTAQGGQPYAGGVEFRTPFGVVYSTNITSDKETGIGGWSFEDFHHAMKHGERPDGTQLYPAFPYTAFAKLTDGDIGSLYLYMRTIEPVANAGKPNDLRFPYSVRPLLRFWKTLFHDSEAYAHDRTKSDMWNRGAYLVEGPGHCGACHTPRNFLGAERKHLALTGGSIIDKVGTGKFREWSSVNLTPANAGLARWSEKDIADYLKTGKNVHTVVQGPMNDVVMSSTSHLDDADLQAIASYLKGIPANAQAPGRKPDEAGTRTGEVLYTVHCGTCHLPTGAGDEILGVPLAGNPIVQAANPSSLINIILYGPRLPPPPFVVDRTLMKMHGKRLSDADIAGIASYIRTSFGNEAGDVTPEQVKRQR